MRIDEKKIGRIHKIFFEGIPGIIPEEFLAEFSKFSLKEFMEKFPEKNHDVFLMIFQVGFLEEFLNEFYNELLEI